PHKAGNGDLTITCRNRHCPRCQTHARDRWIETRSRDLLPTAYAHVVFTIDHALARLALQNKADVYSLLMRTSAETLLTVAADPQHLGPRSGSSVFCIPGIRSFSRTLTHDARHYHLLHFQ